MIRSPGTKRIAALPVPEEVQLKLNLLGVRLLWDRSMNGFVMLSFDTPIHDSTLGRHISARDILQHGWDEILTHVADTMAKPIRPVGWNQTHVVPDMEIPAAAVIEEDAFRVKS